MSETTTTNYKIGDRVVSDLYGAGEVIDVDVDAESEDQRVRVRFPGDPHYGRFLVDPTKLTLVETKESRVDALVAALTTPAALDVPFALVPGGKAPVRATEGAAAVDLFARIASEHEDNDADHVVVPRGINKPNRVARSWGVSAPVVAIPLGVRVAIPAGHVGLLFSRSSLGKRGLVIPNGVGVIDSDYRGEVSALLQNLSGEDLVIRDGERIAQMIVLPIPAVAFVLVAPDALGGTARGDGAFGSTGVGEIKKDGE